MRGHTVVLTAIAALGSLVGRAESPSPGRELTQDEQVPVDCPFSCLAEARYAHVEATRAHRSTLGSNLSLLDPEYDDPVRAHHAHEIATSNRMRTATLQRAGRLDNTD